MVGSEEKGSSERDLVEVYSPSEGAIVERLHMFKSGEEEGELEDVSGVAVDASGTLWVVLGRRGRYRRVFAKSPRKTGGVRLMWAAVVEAYAGSRREIRMFGETWLRRRAGR